MDKRRLKCFLLLMAMGTVGCLMSCVSNSEDELFPNTNEAEVAVSFASAVGAAGDTRATYTDRKGPMSTTEDLKQTGFGVFSFYSGKDEYQVEGEKSGKTPFNFMYNQRVTYLNTVNDVTNWTYDPLKYWPNDNKPADNQGAMGSVNKSFLSFFAYAPYTENMVTEESASTTPEIPEPPLTPDPTVEEGSIAVTQNTAASGTSYIKYRMSDVYPGIFDKNVDLLWAARPNLWKMMDETERNEDGSETVTHPGYVNGQVKFNFKHALSKFTICVQGLFDRTSTSDNSAAYPDDVDSNTRVLVEGVDFKGSPLMKQGKMYLVPNSEKTTNTLATVPRWELAKEDKMDLVIEKTAINSTISNTYMTLDGEKKYNKDYFPQKPDRAEVTKEAFDELPIGVTHEEVSLFNQGENGEDVYYLVIPNKDYIENNNEAMQVHIVYYVITYDPNLILNTPRYCSIVKNDITATFSKDFAFEPNKQYKLRLLLGLTTVKFELEMSDEWDVPLKMDPVVIDWHIERREIEIN